jgi:hypothetical protein
VPLGGCAVKENSPEIGLKLQYRETYIFGFVESVKKTNTVRFGKLPADIWEKE